MIGIKQISDFLEFNKSLKMPPTSADRGNFLKYRTLLGSVEPSGRGLLLPVILAMIDFLRFSSPMALNGTFMTMTPTRGFLIIKRCFLLMATQPTSI